MHTIWYFVGTHCVQIGIDGRSCEDCHDYQFITPNKCQASTHDART